MKELVSSKWLKENLNNPDLVVLDASVEMNPYGKAFKKFDETIPNARKFDLKNVFVDKSNTLPNTVPKPKEFEIGCKKLGINQNSEIVIFDNNGIYSSPRAWWLFVVMGHEKVSVLDGGLPDWIDNGFQTAKKHLESFKIGDFRANLNKAMLITYQQVFRNISQQDFLLVDARSENRFNGTGKEPREYLKSGKVKNAINIPFQKVLQNGKYRSKNELKRLFEDACSGEKELVFSCGSGMTACVIMLACQISYGKSKKIYDGSWTEWAEINHLKFS